MENDVLVAVPPVPIKMTLSLTVEGKEGMDITITWKNTDLTTVKMVENMLMHGFTAINNA